MIDPFIALYDPKTGRKVFHTMGCCPKCKKWNGHRLDCSAITKADAMALCVHLTERLAATDERAGRYWKQLQHATGKLAVLKHENNKLRRANAKLKGA